MLYICEFCKKEFKYKIGLINHLKRKISCKDYNSKCFNPKCSNKVEYPNKFCSCKCAGKVNSPGREQTEETRRKISISHGGTGIILPTKICLNCEKSTKKKFCSNSCQQEYIYNKLILDWLQGKINGNSKCGLYAPFIKKYLLRKNNHKCSKCGWGEVNPYSNIVSLEVEHIDGNPYNNSPNNLDLLCPNCHSLTKTFKGLNTKNIERKTSEKQYRRL